MTVIPTWVVYAMALGDLPFVLNLGLLAWAVLKEQSGARKQT